MKRLKTILVLFLALALALSVSVIPAAAAGSATATTLRLAKATGSVTVKNSSGKNQSIKTDMRLYNGYTVSTAKSSAAYISLDGTKAVKLDASSKGSVKKAGSKLEVCLDSGNLYFNVTVPLAANESMNIRTSTMITGIRGSYGWVTNTEVGLMHGHVTVTCINPVTGATRVTELYSGERVYYGPGSDLTGDPNLKEIDFIKSVITNDDIPSFVVEEMRSGESLRVPVIEDVPSVDVPKLLDDYESIKAAEDAITAEKEAELNEKLTEQEKLISNDRSDYLFQEESVGTVEPDEPHEPHINDSYTVTFPTVRGMQFSSSDPSTDIAPGTEFHFSITPSSGYALYEEYLEVSAGSTSVSLSEDGAGGFNASLVVDSNTSITASGAVYQADTFDDAIAAFQSGDEYAELIEAGSTTPRATIEQGKTLIVSNETDIIDALTNNGTIINKSYLGITGGFLTNNGTIEVNGSLFVSGGTLNNYGTITNREAIEVGSNGNFNNYSGDTLVNEGHLIIEGTFDNGDGEMYDGRLVNRGLVSVTGELNNNRTGTIENGTDGEFSCNGTFNNDGDVINDGSMDLNNFSVIEDASFINRGTLTAGSSFMNDGTFDNIGTLDINYTFQNNSLFTNTGLIDNTEGAIYNGSSNARATFNNSGEIKMLSTTQGGIYNENGTFSNNENGSITGYGQIYNYSVFNNQGVISARGFEMIGEDATMTGSRPTIIAIFSVCFESNGYAFGDNYMLFSDQAIADGQKAREPEEAPLGDGMHVFVGWYQEEECINEFDFDKPITHDTYIYAKWAEATP